jgi:predicted transposase/invertase (TIGR01784 family)
MKPRRRKTNSGKRRRQTPHDRFFKKVFGRGNVAAELLRCYLPPEVVSLLDLSRVELDAEAFVDDKLREHFSDLLYRVGLRSGDEAFVQVLIEHKSYSDKWVHLQTLRYQALEWERQRQNGIEPLRVIIPFVLHHGGSEWHGGRRFSELFRLNDEHEMLRRYVPECETLICDISQFDDSELVGVEGVNALLLLMKHIPRPDLRAILPVVFALLAKQDDDEQLWEQLSATVQYLKQAEVVAESEIADAMQEAETGGEIMETFLDRMQRDWIRKGERKGQRSGWRKGLREGQKKKALEMTLRQLEIKVGELDDATSKLVRALSLPQLERLSERLLDFETQDDLNRWLRRSNAATRRRTTTK